MPGLKQTTYRRDGLPGSRKGKDPVSGMRDGEEANIFRVIPNKQAVQSRFLALAETVVSSSRLSQVVHAHTDP